MHKSIECGVEISAQELVVVWTGKQDGPVERTFANTAAGHKQLLGALGGGQVAVKVCMEATGVYGLDLALLLSAQEGIEVMVANPRAVRHFAEAIMQRGKNDRLDARMLWEFARRMPFTPWVRPGEKALQLWALSRRLQALTRLQAAEKNRRHAAGVAAALPSSVRQSIQRMLRTLADEIRALRKQALRCLAGDVRLERRYRLLCSMPGIGPVSAISLLGELVMLPEDRDVRQWVAFAGLDPREHSSGTSVRKRTRISKAGNRHLRHALFMPALVASRRDPHLRAFYEHLLAEAKRKKLALIAVARKMLHAIYGMFRWDRPYDGSRVYRLRDAAVHAADASAPVIPA